jgi:aspartyl protease family protein
MQRLGKGMTYAAWVLGLALLTLLFSDQLERQQNPNRNVQAEAGVQGSRELVLKRNRAGHYVAGGSINGYPVTFLLDTGATDVAIPERVARRIGLERGRRSISRTAAGDVMTWSALLRSVDLGGLELNTIPATILPDMPGDQVLLGMSYLKRLELVQRGDTLTLRLP